MATLPHRSRPGGKARAESSCFSFLGFCWPWPSTTSTKARSSVVLDDPAAEQLLDLPSACREVQGFFSWSLLKRRGSVAWRLTPVAVRILADNLRSSGPRRAVENTRRLRLALESLGPAFVKLGQAAASREDVLSDRVAAELRKLCDQVAPFPDEEARRLVIAQLGSGLSLGRCVAAASLGQVQRPGLNRALAMDVVILKGIARFLRRVMRCFMAAAVDPEQVVDEWAKTLWDELDYKHEGRAMEHMRDALCGTVGGLVIPRVHWELTALRVLASEWVDGFKITEDPRRVTQRHISIGVEAVAAMILEVGVVHADPHPGNIILTQEDDICLLDFGMVCLVPEHHRTVWAKCVVDLVRRDHGAVLDDLIEIGFFPRECPREEMLPVLSKIWDQLVECGSDITKRKSAVQLLYSEILTLVRRFEFALPDYYVALVRALLTLEGMALAADCNFDIFEAAFPAALRFLTRSRGPKVDIFSSSVLSALQNKTLAKLALRSAGCLQLDRRKVACVGFFGMSLISLYLASVHQA